MAEQCKKENMQILKKQISIGIAPGLEITAQSEKTRHILLDTCPGTIISMNEYKNLRIYGMAHHSRKPSFVLLLQIVGRKIC